MTKPYLIPASLLERLAAHCKARATFAPVLASGLISPCRLRPVLLSPKSLLVFNAYRNLSK